MGVEPETYAEKLGSIKSAVYSLFHVSDVRYEAGVLTFITEKADIKDAFKRLYNDLKPMGYVPTAERMGDSVVIKIYPFKPPRIGSARLPLILMAVTCTTVFIDGLLRSNGIYKYASTVYENFNAWYYAALFTVSLLAIIGIHELGHKIVARMRKIDSTLPYFIPGIPGEIPTFGAVILQKGPLVNKDDLFDLGISGPIAGFAVSLLVLFLAYSTAIWVPYGTAEDLYRWMQSEGGIFLPRPFIFDIFESFLGRDSEVPLIAFTPYAFPAWLGMLVTGLNMVPIWQLDGGRVMRALVSRRVHMILSYVGAVFLFITGYVLMALLLLLLMRNTMDLQPLDTVSSLSLSRKLIFLGGLVMLAVTFVALPSPFIPQLRGQ
ncbi:MAG: site-2 protease family protein [Aigarchaeota archaeon]|nr:site-2 protease family protein [Aigarchaeota archaeon]MDW8092316.1 site-2 protease family protein [Nitrososphaerota archaeon]